MAETRRQLFKASVLSALGLMTGAAVAACTRYGITEQGPDEDFSFPIVGYSGSAHLWYIFDTADGVKYKVRSTPAQVGSNRPSIVKFDTKQYLEAAQDPQSGVILTPVTESFKLDGMKFTFGNDGYLDQRSTALLASANHQLAQVHWNEIGSK